MFRRYELFDPQCAALPLCEGIVPSGQAFVQQSVEVEPEQYGAYVEISDLLMLTSIDDVLLGSTQLLGEEVSTALEWITRDTVCASTNVQYASGKIARAELAPGDVLTVREIQKAVRTLKKVKARPFYGKGRQGHFVCVCSPEAAYDLQCDPLWRDTSCYSNSELIYRGELGRLFGVVFVESTEAKVFREQGRMDIHATPIFGADAYGVINPEEKRAIETILHTPDRNGTDDPLS